MAEIDIPPGIVKTQSEATARGRYVDAQWVRFVAGRPEKMKGFAKLFDTQLLGTPRGMHAFKGPTGLERIGVGTDRKLYYIERSGTITDITPRRYIAVTLGNNPFATTNTFTTVTVTDTAHGQITNNYVFIQGAAVVAGITIDGSYLITVVDADSYTITHSVAANATTTGGGAAVEASYSQVTLGTDPFSMTNGLPLVTVTHTAHGALDNAYVTFSGATAAGGITISGGYTLTRIDANSYTITHSSNASSTTTGGGAVVVAGYDINPGALSASYATGFGVGPFGAETYGTARTASALTRDPRYWSLDNYGSFLIGAYTDGTVYIFDEDSQLRADALANAPTDVRYMFVTEERYVMALCDDMYLRWPDRDDTTDWTAGAQDTANTRRLTSGNRLIAGTTLGGGQGMIWSDTSAYLLQYTGSEFVYDTRLVGESCGLVGPGAHCVGDGRAFWMSANAFYMYAGYVQPIPRHEEVSSWVFANMTQSHRIKSFALYNSEWREVWFVYPATSQDEPNRYVAVNIDTYDWTLGTLSRVGACTGTDENSPPYMATSDGYVYEHERVDVNADGAAQAWFLETGLTAVPGAAKSLDVFHFSPDFDRIIGVVSVTVSMQDRALSTSVDSDTVTIEDDTELTDLRLSGRHFKIRYEGDAIDNDWRGGIDILMVQEGGERP